MAAERRLESKKEEAFLKGVSMNDRVRVGSNGLGRLLASENSATDLLAMLIDLDSEPVSPLFDLPDNEPYVELREVQAQGKRRLDLVLQGADSKKIRAALEMKGASSIHGDQLKEYAAWASAISAPTPGLFFCAFDEEEGDADSLWTRLRLRDVYACWQDSAHPQAAWLARSIVELLEQWDEEANGWLGETTGYYVSDIVTKRIARRLAHRLNDELGPSDAVPTRDNAGSPMVYAWAAHPQHQRDCSVSVGVDLRTTPRRQNGKTWKFRPNVEVAWEDLQKRPVRTRHEAQTLAFDLASKIRSSMSCSALKEELSNRQMDSIAAALSGGKHDGFKSPAASFDFDAQLRLIVQTESYPGAGPFGSDKGLRISTILALDVTALTRNDVEKLIAETISILHAAAAKSLE